MLDVLGQLLFESLLASRMSRIIRAVQKAIEQNGFKAVVTFILTFICMGL